MDGCVEGEWLAEDSYGRTVIVRGCMNDPPPGSRTISNPSETLLSAAATFISSAQKCAADSRSTIAWTRSRDVRLGSACASARISRCREGAVAIFNHVISSDVT